MPYVFLAIATVLFAVGMRLLGIVSQVRHIIADTRAAASVMATKHLSDEQKETAIQAAAIRMLAAFFKIVLLLAVASAVALAAVLLGIGLDLYTAEDAARASLNPIFLVSSAVLLIGFFKVVR